MPFVNCMTFTYVTSGYVKIEIFRNIVNALLYLKSLINWFINTLIEYNHILYVIIHTSKYLFKVIIHILQLINLFVNTLRAI